MVKRILSLFGKEISSVHQAAYLLGFFAVLSTILALIRDRVLASAFGAGQVLDLYYSAFRIPDIMFVTVSSLVSASVLIPFIINKMDEGEDSIKRFLNSIWTFYLVFVVLLSAIIFFLVPVLSKYLFPIFYKSDQFEKLVLMTRILLLSPIFLGLSNLFSSITQVYKRFFIYAISPIFYNIGIIAGAVFLFPKIGPKGLVFGVVLGALMHFLVQVPFVSKLNLFPKFSMPDFGSIKKVIFVSLPRTVTMSASELSELFLVSFASFLVVGSVSIFNLSFNLQSVPYSVIGISYSLAAFPTLTRLFSSGEKEKFLDQMVLTSKHIIFWSIPISILFIVLRAQIVRVLLGAGRFDWSDTKLTAACLSIWTISLVCQNLSTLFVRSFYARNKTKIPLYINTFGAVSIILFSYIFVWIFNNSELFKTFIEVMFKVSGISGSVVLMLPLGYSFGMLLTITLHLVFFQKEFKGFISQIRRVFFEIFSSSIIAGFIAYKSLDIFDNIFNINTFLGIFMQGFLSGILALIILLSILYMFKNQELFEITDILKKKFWKQKITLPEAEL
jgi:putative peptidoglycan lipid II flippase